MYQIRNFMIVLVMAFLPAALLAQPDRGQYVILSAQYGTNDRHVDVTDRLRELARHDVTFRMGNSTFGVDPDPGRVKVLRIYARGPNGDERMFEYREGSVVDGSLFREWGRGEWGRGGWSGRWDVQGGGAEYQPNMQAAMQYLQQAQQSLQNAASDKGGHKERALQLVNQAMGEVQEGMQYANRR